MKPKSSYAFGFGFGTVLPVFQWHRVICAKYYLRYSGKSTWLLVTGLERDWAGLDLRGVGDRALVGLQDQGEGGGQIWVGGIELWVGVTTIRLKCNATLFKCNATFLEWEAALLKCKATLLKCNATLSKCNATFLECDATLLESSGGLDWAREWGQTTWSGDTPALS